VEVEDKDESSAILFLPGFDQNKTVAAQEVVELHMHELCVYYSIRCVCVGVSEKNKII
jgi:hypothetical protein